ncbi:MAG: ABC transporter substrate-binding protein [Deltaproteobacteria bacterium]|nr:ABC transporter substrate-binding protein [Deltaproteobacteria bacterium]
MKNLKRISVLLIAGMILVAGLAHAAAREKLKMVFSPDHDFVMDASIAIEKGFFNQLGLDLDYVTVKGGSPVIIATLPQKDINGVFLASPTALTAIDKGIDLVQISGIGNRTFDYVVLKDSPVKSLKDLNGKTIANTPKPAGPWLALKYDLDKFNVKAKVVEMRTGGDRFSALLTGHVDACLSSPQAQALYGDEIRIVHSSTMSKYIWNSCGWWIKREFLKAHPEAARRFVKGLAMARKLINENPDEAVNIFSKYGKIRNKRFKKPFVLAQFDNPPVIYAYGLGKVNEILQQYGLMNKKINVSDIVDNRFSIVINHSY